MEMDITSDPIQVGPFGLERVMVKAHKAAGLLKQSGRLGLTFHGLALIFSGSDVPKSVPGVLIIARELLT